VFEIEDERQASSRPPHDLNKPKAYPGRKNARLRPV
jgi:hypothetical protein